MKRKILYLFLVSIAMGLFGIGEANALDATPEKCFVFSERTGTILGYYDDLSGCSDENLVIPNTIDGVQVQKIGYKAFAGVWYFQSVILPTVDIEIGDLAFYDNYIEEIPDLSHVTKMGYGAFNNNPINEPIYAVNDGVVDTSTLTGVAYKCPMDGFCDNGSFILNEDATWKVVIPSNVTKVANKAFYGVLIEELKFQSNDLEFEKDWLKGSFITNIIANRNIEMPLDVNIYKTAAATFGNNHLQLLEAEYVDYVDENDDKFLNYELQYTIKPYINDATVKVYQSKYNRINFSIYNEFGFKGVDIYKYNYKTNKYEYLTYYAPRLYSSDMSFYLTRNINVGKTYDYMIRPYTYNIDNKKVYGNPIYKWVEMKLNTPKSVKATALTSKKYKKGAIKLSYGKVDGATGYSIYKYNSKTKKYYLWVNTKKTSVTNTGLKKGYYYYYKVKAYRVVDGKKVYSDFSKVASVKTRR